MPKFFRYLTGAVLFAIAAAQAPGQTPQLAFAYKGPADVTAADVGVGGTITVPTTAVKSTTTVLLLVTNKGGGLVNLNQIAVTGPGFAVTPAQISVQPNTTGLLTVTFSPATAGIFSGSLAMTVEQGQPISFKLAATAVGPNLITSYFLNPDGNQTPVADGGSIAFSPIIVGQSGTATFVVTNTGSGAGVVNAVAITGSAFKLSGLPLLPANVAPGADVRFNLVFTPSTLDAQRGSLSVDLGTVTRTFVLSAQGSGAVLSYTQITATDTTVLSANGTIVLPAAAINGSSSATIQVSNTGSAAGRVASVAVVGSNFVVSDLAPLPVTLAPGDTMTFRIVFSPKDSGPSTAKLLIDSALFNLQANGLGSKLTFSFRVGQSITPVADSGTVNFPNTAVSAKLPGEIDIANTGNVAGVINSISLTGQAFAMTAPVLPLTLQPGDTAVVPLIFSPDSVATRTGVLTIENQTINLRGIGTAPPPLPSYSFTGVGGSADPLTQPSVGLSLASSYPADITGTLTLTFTSDSFVDDPVIQFSPGGRTLDFRIPANTTTAIFGSSGGQVQFQSGTVAGSIGLSASFATGSVDLTPNNAAAKTVKIPAGAPQLRNVQIGTRTATTFEILITGFSTARSVTGIVLQFAAAPGANVTTPSLTINAASSFSAWYQSAASNTVGSQFTASVTVTASGDLSAVQSVTVTASNAQGTSNSMTAALR
ncbi:MAG: choice-of-anchor domain [Bryobacterales bacterium]|nr:choice-of-anchor domain [Bryobacterales bacterium]